MSEESAPQPQIKFTWIIGILAAFAIFALIGAYSSRMTWDTSNYYQQRALERKATLDKLRNAANQTLTTADWVDQNKKIVRIPIDEAMAKEIDTLKSKSAQVGAEIPGSTPAPVAAPAAPAGTNAAPVAAPAPPATNAAPVAPAPPAKPAKAKK